MSRTNLNNHQVATKASPINHIQKNNVPIDHQPKHESQHNPIHPFLWSLYWSLFLVPRKPIPLENSCFCSSSLALKAHMRIHTHTHIFTLLLAQSSLRFNSPLFSWIKPSDSHHQGLQFNGMISVLSYFSIWFLIFVQFHRFVSRLSLRSSIYTFPFFLCLIWLGFWGLWEILGNGLLLLCFSCDSGSIGWRISVNCCECVCKIAFWFGELTGVIR